MDQDIWMSASNLLLECGADVTQPFYTLEKDKSRARYRDKIMFRVTPDQASLVRHLKAIIYGAYAFTMCQYNVYYCTTGFPLGIAAVETQFEKRFQ